MSPSRGVKTTKSENSSEFSSIAQEKLLENDVDPTDTVLKDFDITLLTRERTTSIAACFLRDYEAGRPPSFLRDISRISDLQLRSHQVVFSNWWRVIFLFPATFCLFVTFFKTRFWTTAIHFYAVVIFALDLHLKHRIFGDSILVGGDKTAEFYVRRLTFLFLVVMGVQSWLWFIWATPNEHVSSLACSVFKPLTFFYLSRRAREALQALVRISRILVRVIAIELFLILIFAAVACRLYYGEEGFESLASSWLSLFKLSTTVVNPSLWMPVYSKAHVNAVFFVIFIVVCVFYLHSLILSVVFQVFIQAATEVHDRSSVDKEDSIRSAYRALSSWQMVVQDTVNVPSDLIRETLAKVRPHYGTLKLDILMELVDTTQACSMNYNTFRTKISKALNSSIRSARKASIFASGIEILSVMVTIVNFLFVTLLTSRYQAEWFNASMVMVGSLITIFCILELAMRCNICTLTYYPMTRLNAVFDTFAGIGAFVSCYGICIYLFQGNQKALNYLYTGRAVDMIRSMRFFSMFRDVVERSVDVLPALEGPVLLVLTSVHVFVCIGMLLWCGHIDAGELIASEYLQPFFSLNNFNSYSEGLVTIFNVMVVNDWHQIAQVFLYADRFSEPHFVYPYFVIVVLVAVCVMLNVITAFFVETFVTRLSKDDIENDGVIALQKAQAEFSIPTPSGRSSKPSLLYRQFSWQSLMGDDLEAIQPPTSSRSSSSTEVVHFDVFERQGFDRIMKTVGSVTSDQHDIAKCIRDTIDAISSLSPCRREVECLICCLPSLLQFHTSGFRASVLDYIDSDSLDSVIHDLAAQLGSTQQADEWVVRHYRHPVNLAQVLSLSAKPLPHVEGMILFVLTRDDLPAS